jgi:Ca2+-binding RTX toxin-like protein
MACRVPLIESTVFVSSETNGGRPMIMGTSRGILTVIAAGAAVLVLGAASPSGASETVGSELRGTAAGTLPGDMLATQTTPPPWSAFSTFPTSSGVITKVLLKHGPTSNSSEVLKLRILSGATPNFKARSDPRLPDLFVPINQPAGVFEWNPTDSALNPRGVPIRDLEHLAVGSLHGTIAFVAGEAGARMHIRSPIPGPSAGTVRWKPFNIREVLLQYTVEPDTDGDGYGDETQDACRGFKAGIGPGCAAGVCLGLPATHVGTNRAESIIGTPGNDVIAALGGNDLVIGGGGDDIICGGAGSDRLEGGVGNDRLKGGRGRDVCKGGPGVDAARKCETVRSL